MNFQRCTRLFLLVASAAIPCVTTAEGLTPAQAVKEFTIADGLAVSLVVGEPQVSQPLSISFDDRGRMWVLQYLQYPIPEGRKPVEVDRYLRTKYDKVPPPPPNGPKGRDRISIYEDTDGDGRPDKIKHFLSNLNLASGMALGHGGVFVAQPPYLLFYPDKNGDDVPDSDPQVLLEGFGMNDAHAFANSLTWGPDGWLYGAQGSTVTANIRGIGFQQGIWRYHPLTKQFELFAEGGGNTWGIDFDRYGNLYAGGNTVEPLVHHVQGAYYVKGFGKHGPLHNPHTYGYFPPVKHHGYAGDSLTGGFVLYQGGAFPERFRDACIAPNTRHSAMRWSTLEKRGSTFATRAAGDFLTSRDIWFRPIESTVGPDGALYVADWYDYNISHSSPKNRSQWYMPSRFDGRVWRVAPPQLKPPARGQLRLDRKTSDELIDLLGHPNDWYARQARRILAERRDTSIHPRLNKLLSDTGDERLALQALWSLYVSGGFDSELAARALDSRHEYVRAWTVRLLGDERKVPGDLQPRLVQLARYDRSVVVRSQLACTAKRLPAGSALAIVGELLRRSEDAADVHVPLLLWWAIENKAISDRDRVLRLVEPEEAWRLPLVRGFLIERLARRYAAEGTAAGFKTCARLMRLAPDEPSALLVVGGILKAYAGRRIDQVPADLRAPLSEMLAGQKTHPQVLQLAIRMGIGAAIGQAQEIVADADAEMGIRLTLIETLGQTGDASSSAVLQSLLNGKESPPIQAAVLSSLVYFSGDEVSATILKSYPRFDAALRVRAIDTLCNRREWSVAVLQAVNEKHIDSKEVTLDQVRRMLQHDDPLIRKLVAGNFGRVTPATPHEKRGRIAAVIGIVARGAGDIQRGAAVFEKTCAACHKLHGKGNTIGPDLTGAERKDRNKLVSNIVDPSAEIRQQYISHVVETTDGRVLTGLLAESKPETITILDAKNTRTVVNRSQVDELKESPISLMPERILEPLSDQQLRDLFAYLQSATATEP